MLLLLKAGSIILVLVILLRLKLNLSLAVLGLCFYTIFLFKINLELAFTSSVTVPIEKSTIELLIILVSVIYIAAVQKKKKMFDLLISALNAFIKDSRIVTLISPAIIGLLPMPGGALVSAPLVESSTRKMDLKPEFKTFLNYWFRHPWEYIWPIYAGLLIFQAMSHIPLKIIVLYQLPYTFIHILGGLSITFYFLKKLNIKGKIKSEDRGGIKKNLINFFSGIWPILLIILLFFIVSLPLYIALALVAIILTFSMKLKPSEIFKSLFSKFIFNTILLILSVLIFKRIIEISNAFNQLASLKVPVEMVVLFIFLVSFTVGFLTGVNTAYIAIAFPVLLPLIQSAGYKLEYFTLPLLWFPLPVISNLDQYIQLSVYVYVIGFAGILFSPLHLCLVLTNQYFNSSLIKVYKYLWSPVLFIVLSSTVLVLIL